MKSSGVLSIACSFTLLVFVLRVDAATIIKGPFLHNVTKTSIVIGWETDSAATGQIDIGTDQSYGTVVPDPESKRYHEVRVEGLSAETEYHFIVTVGESDTVTEDATFRTAVNAGTPFKFSFYGDPQSLNADHRATVDVSVSLDPDFYIILGDMVEIPDEDGWWPRWFDNERKQMRDTPLYPVKGNHDGGGDTLATYFELLRSNLHYSFDYGNAHFVNLTIRRTGIPDTGSGYFDYVELNSWIRDSSQLWLEADLAAAAANPETDWIFVLRHQPYVGGTSWATGSREWPDDVFERYDVDFILVGDAHAYGRGVPLAYKAQDFQGTVQILSGAASKLHPGSSGDTTYDAWRSFVLDTNLIQGELATNHTLHHCSYMEINGREVIFKDFASEDGTLYDSCRVVKDENGNVILRENSKIPSTPVRAFDAKQQNGLSAGALSLNARGLADGTGLCIVETAGRGNLKLEIHDMAGRRVACVQRHDVAAGRHMLNVPAPSAGGVYTLSLRHGLEQVSRRFSVHQ